MQTIIQKQLLSLQGFKQEILNKEQEKILKSMAVRARSDVLRMCTNAGSGHPGGSMSSLDIFLLLWLGAKAIPSDDASDVRDHIVVSHGHTAPGVYAALSQCGYLSYQEVVEGFRCASKIFAGQLNIEVPGVDWESGILGQGLSVGCGFALGARLRKSKSHVFVVMGDGEQQKGQIKEAINFAVKYKLANLTAIIDCNQLQAMGTVKETMPLNIAEEYKQAGWRVIKVNGHSFTALYKVLRSAYKKSGKPTAILAKTVMGKGVSFMENRYEFHGKILTPKQLENALKELNPDESCLSDKNIETRISIKERSYPKIKPGVCRVYPAETKTDCRSAFGRALMDIADNNIDQVPIAVLDCDLSGSVKTADFAKKYPRNFIQCGISEHNAANIAGALSKSGILTFFAGFAVFTLYESFHQQRLNDINRTAVKLISTHCGLDVGEDGKSHQCLDYIGISAGLPGFKLLIPADPNQADCMTRFTAVTDGNIAIAMGRNQVPVLCDREGKPLFNKNYRFEYGRADWLRNGDNGTIATYGVMASKAVEASDRLSRKGIHIGVLNIGCPFDLDADKIREAAATGLIISFEDHNIRTGLGVILGTYLAEESLCCRFHRLGVKGYGGSGKPDELYRLQNLSVNDLMETVTGLALAKHSN